MPGAAADTGRVISAAHHKSAGLRRTAALAGIAAISLLAPSVCAAQSWAGAQPPTQVVHGCTVRPATACPRTDLRGAQLFGAHLRGADLHRARLGGANLVDADLRGARLGHADLSPATGPSVNGKNAGRLRPTHLTLADLRGARLGHARLERVVAVGADLRHAHLRRAGLRFADLADAYLAGADLRGADLHGAELRRADLRGADLRGADLQGTDLQAADLRGVRLQGANLVGAQLAGSSVTRLQLDEARVLCLTSAAGGAILRRDCPRLGIKGGVPIPSLLAPHRTGPARGHVRHVRVPTGPRLAAPPAGPRAGRADAASASSAAGCNPEPGADCEGAYRAQTSNPGAYAPGSDLYLADFDLANLEGADLEGSFLAAAQFDGANLSRANLSHTTGGLQPQTDVSTNYDYANLEGADFTGANLRGAQFLGANLRGANLEGADLSEAYLYGADLRGANLQGATMEGTQLTSAGMQEANLLGSFLYDASFSYTNFEGALLGVYMQGAPGGGFSGQEGSLNLDQAGWTCQTTLPGGQLDSDDCTFTFKLVGELIAGIAESVDGFEFGAVSSSVVTTAVRSALEDTTSDLGGTGIRLANWALFQGSPSGLTEIVASSSTLNALQTNVLPVVKLVGVKVGGIAWEVVAPPSKVTPETALAAWERAHGDNPSLAFGNFVYSPVEEWTDQWEANLYAWWGTKTRGDEYARIAGCPMAESSAGWSCEVTGNPVSPAGAPTAQIAGA